MSDIINNNDAMPEEEEGVVILTDEDGQEIRFEIIMETEKNGTHYFAMIPVDEQKEDSEIEEYVILKLESDGEEEFFVTIDDDDEYDDIADYFDDIFSQEFTEAL